ncbi:MAG TPA: hypothetical protein VGF86_14395 [Candidatus Tumulicola sp.]|jgi:hypothetical protein
MMSPKSTCLLILSLALSACGGAGTTSIPGSPPSIGDARQFLDSGSITPADSTSILKKLTKDVTIGSTVDAKNGDMGPRAISVAPTSFGKLKKDQILVCNFEDKSADAGKGTTLEVFSPNANSKPTTFAQSSKIEGCDGTALTSGNQVYATGMTSKLMVYINQSGQIKQLYSKPITMPIGVGEAPSPHLYAPIRIYVGNGDTGTIDTVGLGAYGTKLLEIIKGFPVSKGSGWNAEGPSGLVYSCGIKPPSQKCHDKKEDVLYVADGACNGVVSISNVSSLLIKDEITVGAGCKSFKCLYSSTSCGKLVKSGSPLNKPFAAAILPNGNIVVANSGDNTLVELTPSGTVLGTKVIDKSKTPGIWGLYAIGTSDANTAIYYTDTNSNELHELEQ